MSLNYLSRLALSVKIVLIFFLSQGCQKKKMNKDELTKFIRHNESLDKRNEVQGVNVELKFFPYQLLVLQEMEGTSPIDKHLVDELEKKYKSQYYFKLSFSKDNKEVIRQLGDFQSYSNMVQILSFELGDYVKGSGEKNDTIQLASFSFERTYGMSMSNDLLLVFNKSDFKDSHYIAVNVKEFGLGIGNLKFFFNRKDIEEVPELQYPATVGKIN